MNAEERKEILAKPGYCRFYVKVNDTKRLCYYYSDIDDRENVIKEMLKYRKTDGFTWLDQDGLRFTCADLILVYESYTGEFYGQESFCDIFDYLNRRKEGT